MSGSNTDLADVRGYPVAKRRKLGSDSDSSIHEAIGFTSVRKPAKSYNQSPVLECSSTKQHQDNYSLVSQRIMV